MHLSALLWVKPYSKTAESNFSCHYFGAYFNSYKDFINLQTLCSFPGKTKPLGCYIYISSSKSSFKKAVLTSIWWTYKLYIDDKAKSILIDVIQATGAYVSK